MFLLSFSSFSLSVLHLRLLLLLCDLITLASVSLIRSLVSPAARLLQNRIVQCFSLSLLYLASKPSIYDQSWQYFKPTALIFFLYSVFLLCFFLFIYLFFLWFEFLFRWFFASLSLSFPFRCFLDFQETERSRSSSLSSLYVHVVLDWRCQANNARLRRRSGAGISEWLRTLIPTAGSPHSILYRSTSLVYTACSMDLPRPQNSGSPSVRLPVPSPERCTGNYFYIAGSPNHKSSFFFVFSFSLFLFHCGKNAIIQLPSWQNVRPSRISIHQSIDRNSHYSIEYRNVFEKQEERKIREISTD